MNLLKGNILQEMQEVSNVKTFSGTMGMSLAKSYVQNKQKICIYNTINGQDEMIYQNTEKKCPKNNE